MSNLTTSKGHAMLKPRPFWLRMIDSDMWVTVYPHIYYPKCAKDPSKAYHIIAHEQVHLRQQGSRLKFWFSWLPRYAFSRSFRLEQEAEAMRMELSLYPNEVDRQMHAYALAGDLCRSYRFLGQSAARSLKEALEALGM